MAYSVDGKLVVAISSRALFDFEDENRVFDREGEGAYIAHARGERFGAALGQGLLEEAPLLAVSEVTIATAKARAPGRGEIRLALAMERLCDDVGQAPTLDELAVLAETSRFTLVRRFRQRFGLPPMAWLQQLRLQRARERIAAGWPLAETALACGFSDQSHLTRLFSRHYGYTPGAWRRAGAIRRSKGATAF